MGLDMYLYAEIYVSTWNGCTVEQSGALTSMFTGVNGAEPRTVVFEAGYWRKANAIHAWFVKNVQDGEDECVRHYVSREKLIELKKACKRVLWYPSVAEDILPTESGFFFGSTEHDEYYICDLNETVEIIDNALKMDANVDFYYRSSW